MRLAGQVTWLGSRGAAFVTSAAKVTVHAGQDIDIHMLEGHAGYTGNRLVPVWPVPYSSRPSVVARTAISSFGSSSQTQAAATRTPQTSTSSSLTSR
jgi:hypothetical protein